LGCGTDIKKGYINLDCAEIDGVDVVHSLEKFPYPFEDNTFDEIIAKHVLEHLDDTIKVMEEIWRICRDNAKVIIRVPYWNSIDGITDPTHKKLFNQHTFEFFDPAEKRCKRRPYYTKARFRIMKEYYFIKPTRYIKVGNPLMKALLNPASHFLCNIIRALEYELSAVKK
jgi:SAM-dependent methyltransferase